MTIDVVIPTDKIQCQERQLYTIELMGPPQVQISLPEAILRQMRLRRTITVTQLPEVSQ